MRDLLLKRGGSVIGAKMDDVGTGVSDTVAELLEENDAEEVLVNLLNTKYIILYYTNIYTLY